MYSRARVGRGDPAGLRAGVPVVDRVVVLDAGVGALPRGLAPACRNSVFASTRLDDLAGRAREQAELAAALDRVHELVGDADRVVRVLVLHATRCPCRRGPCRSPASRSARILSSSRALVSMNSSTSGWSTSSTTIFAARRVAPPDLMVPAEASAPRMKRDRAGRGAAGGQQLLGRPDAGQVEPGAGAALEDQALLPVPVEDRLHRVVDGEDEAVVHPEVAGQVLAGLGLDVVDLHGPEVLDAVDLQPLGRARPRDQAGRSSPPACPS